MSYVDELLPVGDPNAGMVSVAKSATGGPRMSLSVVGTDGGGEERARRWPSFVWEYNIGVGVRDLATLDQVYSHYLAVGPENSFPFFDLVDNSSRADNRSTPATTNPLDQVIGVGTGSLSTFQLVKNYTFGARTYVRNIRKPKNGSVYVSVGTTVQTVGTNYSIDHSTGTIVFQAGSIPANGATVRASYTFYVPVFYGKEFVYETAAEAIRAGRIPNIPLREDVSPGALTPDWPYFGGGDTINVTSSIVYDYGWGRSVFFNPNADGYSVLLPDINEIPYGGPVFTFSNIATTGTKTLTFRNKATFASEFTLPITKGALVYVRNNNGTKAWLAIQPT